jgi:hypothetical protein
MLRGGGAEIGRSQHAGEPLELSWRQHFTSKLPFQFSNDLFHVANSPF